MSTLKVNTIQNTSGGSGSTPEQILNGRIKAWVEFNGSSDAIRQDYGVSSITDTGTGDYDVNFDTSFSDINYVVFGSVVGSTGDNYHAVIVSDGSAKETGKCPIRVHHVSDTSVEITNVGVAFIR